MDKAKMTYVAAGVLVGFVEWNKGYVREGLEEDAVATAEGLIDGDREPENAAEQAAVEVIARLRKIE